MLMVIVVLVGVCFYCDCYRCTLCDMQCGSPPPELLTLSITTFTITRPPV